jgi:hypothetical protein
MVRHSSTVSGQKLKLFPRKHLSTAVGLPGDDVTARLTCAEANVSNCSYRADSFRPDDGSDTFLWNVGSQKSYMT